MAAAKSFAGSTGAHSATVKPNHYSPPGPIGNTEGLIVPYTEPNLSGGNIAPPIKPTPKEKGWWERWGSEALHTALDIGGAIPVIGIASDGVNAIIYGAEGDYVNAGISGASAAANLIPGGGLVAKGGKLAVKGGQALLKTEVKLGAKVVVRKAATETAEKEAAEQAAKAAAAKKANKNSGGKDTTKPKKAKEHDVKCFKKNGKGDPKEYDRQLADQEKGLNDLTVKEYLEGRDRFKEIGRKGTGAEQRKARTKFNEDLTRRFKTELNEQGVVGKAAQDQAASMAKDKMSTLAALHNPDMIAGGKDVVTAMGDKGVNSSIGSQWKDRVAEMDKAAREVPANEHGNTKMNTKLKRCK